MSVYCRLNVIFKEKNIDQYAFAEKINISLATLSELITNSSLPTTEVAKSIAEELNLKVAEIWILDEE